MLNAVSAPASLVVCSTCRYSADAREDGQGRRGGEIFADALRSALSGHACEGRIDVQPMPCLFACSNPCTVFLRSHQRLGYVLGKFAPAPDSALALLDFAAHYLASPDGVVPYADWPAGVKGHFLVRVPPEDFIWNPSSTVPEKPEGEPSEPL